MKQLLLLHGAIGCKEQFNGLAALLSKDFHIHTMDFSGHGSNNSNNDKNFSISGFAQDVIQELKRRKLDSVLIFGYSMGGYVALYLAIHYSRFVEKIATLGTIIDWTQTIAMQQQKLLNSDKIMIKVPQLAERLLLQHGNNWKYLLHKTALLLNDLGNEPKIKKSDLKKINVPTLVIIGENDKVLTSEDNYSTELNNSKFISLTNSEHPIEQTDVELLAEQLKIFFQP